MARAISVAKFLILLKNTDQQNGMYFSLSNLKLQKLMYYCQGGHYRWDNRQLIDDNLFEAWEYGPVIREIYHEFKIYGQNDITILIPENDPDISILSTSERETIFSIWTQLKHLSAFDLVDQTHSEAPWINAMSHNSPFINEEDIRGYFTVQSVRMEVH